MVAAGAAVADSPFATTVVDFSPAPGQFVNVPPYDDANSALGAPVGGGTANPDNSKLVSLGGFGGSITLKFDHTVMDDGANPHCMDAIVFGNSHWVGGNANRHWAECGTIEISRDSNSNGLPDDAWYLIPGSHITDPAGQIQMQTWDDDVADATFPPEDEAWIPPGYSGTWVTQGYRLPPGVFDVVILENPNGPDATDEGVFGYADFAPVLLLGDLDGDNIVDNPNLLADEFYTRDRTTRSLLVSRLAPAAAMRLILPGRLIRLPVSPRSSTGLISSASRTARTTCTRFLGSSRRRLAVWRMCRQVCSAMRIGMVTSMAMIS